MIVYALINKINDKMYIGKTIKTLEHRFAIHCRRINCQVYAIHRAIQKYGKENFNATVIEKCETFDELTNKEIYWIDLFDSISPNGYNLTTGGEGVPSTPEMRKKMSIAQKGRKLSQERKDKQREIFYRTLTPELRYKYGSATRGKKFKRTQEFKDLMSRLQKGKPAHNRKKVICPNGTFDSANAAAKNTGISVSKISCMCRSKLFPDWEYADGTKKDFKFDKERLSHLKNIGNKKIIYTPFGKFDSVKEAVDVIGYNRKKVDYLLKTKPNDWRTIKKVK